MRAMGLSRAWPAPTGGEEPFPGARHARDISLNEQRRQVIPLLHPLAPQTR